MNLVRLDLCALKEKVGGGGIKHPNVKKEEIAAMNDLASNKCITIKPADKGGAIVVMDTPLYKAEIHRQLSDANVYRLLTGDPVWSIKTKVEKILQEAMSSGIIDQKVKSFLTIEHPVTPVLYVLPKIHKTLDNPPGRPIVSGRGSVLNNISKFLDQVL